MPSISYSTILAAMKKRQQIICVYQGFHRELCVHTIGHKSGKEKILAFQFAGESSKGIPPGGEWRCMFIDDIAEILVKDGAWYTRDNHTKEQTCVDQVEFEVFP